MVGVKLGKVARAYPVEAIAGAEGGIIRDRFGPGTVELRADARSRSVSIIRVPDGAMVAHTFWFAWAAFHPDTEVYGSE